MSEETNTPPGSARADEPVPPLTLTQLAGLAAIVFLSRVPFLLPGYGWDSDAWLIAGTARKIAQTGRYHESRLPGYPVHEVASAFLIACTQQRCVTE